MRLVGKCARNGNALLLAARQLAGITRCFVVEAHEAQELMCSFGVGLLLPATHLERERDILQHRALLEQGEVLEDHSDIGAQFAQFATLIVGNVGPVDDDTTLGRTFEQVEQTHER